MFIKLKGRKVRQTCICMMFLPYKKQLKNSMKFMKMKAKISIQAIFHKIIQTMMMNTIVTVKKPTIIQTFFVKTNFKNHLQSTSTK